MKKLMISLPIERPDRTQATLGHLAAVGMRDVEIVNGLSADVSGLVTKHPYEVDDPGSGFNMGPKPVGIFLGHYIAWSIAAHCNDEHCLIMEDDVRVAGDWEPRYRKAMADVPKDFDALFLGSCDTGNQRRRHKAGEIFEVFYPQCMHCYVIARKAAGYILATQRKVYGPVDCTLIFHTWGALKVYTLLPRLAEQHNTVITP